MKSGEAKKTCVAKFLTCLIGKEEEAVSLQMFLLCVEIKITIKMGVPKKTQKRYLPVFSTEFGKRHIFCRFWK